MKNKRLYQALALAITLFVVDYLLISFIELSLGPSHWTQAYRVIFSGAALIVMGFIPTIYSELDEQ